YVGIVDDLAHQEQAAIRELGPRLVRVLDGAVHAVAEPELVRQPEGQVAHDEGVAAAADHIHDAAVVVSGERTLDRALESEAPAEVGLWHEAESNGAARASQPHRAARRVGGGSEWHGAERRLQAHALARHRLQPGAADVRLE